MATKEIIVFVYLPHESKAVPAGIFRHDDDKKVGEFEYGRQYLQRANALPVDPKHCPLGGEIKTTQLLGGIYGAFRDAAPDAWGRLVLQHQLKKSASELTEIDYLLQGGVSRVGNLDFRPAPDSSEPEFDVPIMAQLEDLIQASSDLMEEKPVAQQLLELLRQGTSMGGARPKCVVEDEGALWLAKFPSKDDTYNNPRVEWATLNLAASAGLKVTQRKIIQLPDGRDVLLLKRFDRDKKSEGYERTGFVSALTLLGVDENDRQSWDYLALAQTLRHMVNDSEDLRELFRRIAFNVAVRNIDDHPRNHGFLVDQTGLRLSPAYDLVPSAAKLGVSTEFNLAMSFGSFGRLATVDNLLSKASSFGLGEEEARNLIKSIGETASAWERHFLANGLTDRDVQLFSGSFARSEEMRRLRPGETQG